MLCVKIKFIVFLNRKVVWYSSKPTIWNCLTTLYKQSTHYKPVLGFVRENFFTKIIDLAKDEKQLLEGFDKNTSYEIRRAEKEHINTTVEQNVENFKNFYNQFAKTKGLPQLNNSINHYQRYLVITKAEYDKKEVVMHSYIIDESLKRVRLLHSASLFRNSLDAQTRAIVGRANRLLHFMDMKYFKQMGYMEYDLGGYALDTKDESLCRINKFKDGFGGKLKQETDYLPFPMVLLSKIL